MCFKSDAGDGMGCGIRGVPDRSYGSSRCVTMLTWQSACSTSMPHKPEPLPLVPRRALCGAGQVGGRVAAVRGRLRGAGAGVHGAADLRRRFRLHGGVLRSSVWGSQHQL